jgi:ElaB/YqjD/DUF883 family membrane-anchored ribosome-binding protein
MSSKIENKNIDEALALLNELAKDKTAELKDMISAKYGNLKSALGGVAGRMQHGARETHARGQKRAEELASNADTGVRKNPWPYLGGTALVFLVLGCFFGGRFRKVN